MGWLLWVGLALASPPTTEVVEGLGDRHDPLPCAALAPGRSEADRLAALIEVAETVEAPAWVPMRAAGCVGIAVEGAEVARAAAARWIASPSTAGLALVVLERGDSWSVDTATALGGIAVERARSDARFASHLRTILARSRNATLRAALD